MGVIRHDIELGFIPTGVLANTIAEAEELDAKGSGEYSCVAYAIDNIGKLMYGAGEITREQWDRLCEKYPVD